MFVFIALLSCISGVHVWAQPPKRGDSESYLGTFKNCASHPRLTWSLSHLPTWRVGAMTESLLLNEMCHVRTKQELRALTLSLKMPCLLVGHVSLDKATLSFSVE